MPGSLLFWLVIVEVLIIAESTIMNHRSENSAASLLIHHWPDAPKLGDEAGVLAGIT